MFVAGRSVRGCGVCGGPTRDGYALCFCCTSLVRQLGLPLVPVTSVLAYRLGDRNHYLLRGYKDAPAPQTRAAATAVLAGMVHRWLVGPGGDDFRARANGDWDLVVGVPSSVRRGQSPIDTLIAAVPELARHHRALLVRGPETVGHLVASRRGFAVAPRNMVGSAGMTTRNHRTGTNRERAIVVDDSLVTGARAQSAAATLRTAGVEVVAVLVVGRVLAPLTER